jgi:hypothetical protein
VLAPNLSPGAAAEKQQLRFLGIGLAAIGGGTWWLFGLHGLNGFLFLLALVALAGSFAYRAIGRGVFLGFSMLSLAIGRVVSWVSVLILYGVVIAGLGLVFRLFGMNRLERNFEACKKRSTMLVDVPPLDPASFRRQS